MGDENRGSSGSSTAMLVVGIVGGLFLVACCGGILVLFGAGFFMARSAARDAQMEVMEAQEAIQRDIQKASEESLKANQEFQKAMDDLNKELEKVKIPDEALRPLPDLNPPPPPGDDGEKK